jgi:hypothetical protein
MPKHRHLLEDCNCLAVRQAARHVTQLYDQHLAEIGLTTPQWSLLRKNSLVNCAACSSNP